MEEIWPREKVLLAYSPSAASNCQSSSSDVDFSDVFGGPPRRSSTTQEFSYSERSSRDFQYRDNDNDVEEDGSRWLQLREKPVFGEVSGVQRRFNSNDFFDDIFRGDQPSSSSQSPRIMPRPSMFASAPGSRVMSPSRSLPPAEPFAAPVKFSLPGRLTNTDFTASTSMNQSFFNPSLSRFKQPIQNQDGIRSSHLLNALRHQDAECVDGSTGDAYLDGIEYQSDINSNAKVSEFPIYAANFHFSIYRWASKGVPLVISRRKRSPGSKEASRLARNSSGNAKGVGPYTPVAETLSSEENVRPSLPVNELFNHSFISSTKVQDESIQDGTATARSNPTSVVNASNELDKACEAVSSYDLEDAKEAHNLLNKTSGSVVQKRNDPPMSLPKEKRSNTRPLRSFINDDNEGNETVIIKKAGFQEKEKPSSLNNVSSHKVDKNKVQKSLAATKKNDARTSDATGKVKDFVKIFSQEFPSKASSPRLRQSHSRRWKEAKTVEVDYEIRFSSARMNDDIEASYVNWEEAWPDTLKMEDENTSGSQQFSVNDIGCVPDTARQTTPNVSNVDSQRDSATNTDAASDDNILGFETKVSQWSKGKEGNIRALLSTLQYVLWPDSGWKPVPLVDIIEANAVKRAYQKALLRLHPDKLQQKGAAPHHKLIAKKVLDILQEAWDQFNSLGSL